MEQKNVAYYMNLPYTIVIRKDLAGGFFAKVEELEGCMTQGETYEEVYQNIHEAMELWLEVSIEQKMVIPEPDIESDYSGKLLLR